VRGLVIGLTGGISSGKSMVSKLFNKYGIPIVDVDQIARDVVQPGEEAWSKIIKHFGQDILLPDHQIDRKQLGNLIFQDVSQREILNKITHPIIINRTMEQARELERRYPQVIVDIPLLFESNRESLFDQIIVVYVPLALQLNRLMERDQISEKEAMNKINSQMSLERKKEKADIIINNDKGVEETEKQVIRVIKNWARQVT